MLARAHNFSGLHVSSLGALNPENRNGDGFKPESWSSKLLHAPLKIAYFGATEMLLTQTKYWKVGSYESGR